MNEENGSKRSAFVGLYLETLRARMAPDQYTALTEAVHRFCRLIADGGQGSFEIDETAFTPALHRELVTIMTMLATGRTDHRLVDIPSPDGTPGYAMAEAHIAEDSTQLAAVRTKLNAWWAQREAEDAVLDGIARASGLETP
ncbi:hypothetical protein [Streptomyces sp. NBC_00690]|uniref:hypothetical protein n=1 Tax=Streptomyces sp. NBC_00690 TaxID=2975808 RepID=UPI002E2BC48D|nr:hypothetical protein [Streptomyces sp. NBC_00690]